MLERRTLTGPITLGVVLIVTVVALTVGWVAINIAAAKDNRDASVVYYLLLAIGSIGLGVVLAGVITYLTLTVKAINLNRRQSNFIDSVTHELKSPIASLKLCLQTLTRRSVDPAQSEDFHRMMLDDVERLDQLINHLLDAARVERGGDAAAREDVHLDELLESCARTVLIRYRVPDETVDIDCGALVLHSRRAELEILFRNLIDNAVKYGGTPPRVHITADTDGSKISVRVRDNGQGIPSNLRRKVFGRFVRLGNELERSKPGTGLGLYLVRAVTRALGGSIHIENLGLSLEGIAGDAAADSVNRERSGGAESGHSTTASDPPQAGPASQRASDRMGNTGTEFCVTLPGLVRGADGDPPSTSQGMVGRGRRPKLETELAADNATDGSPPNSNANRSQGPDGEE
jgi:signal transduction histidine kinase